MAKPPLNPQTARKIVGDMSNSRTMFWVLVAAAIHLVLIVGTSVGYIRDRWIDPEGADARHKAEAEKTPATPTPATNPTSQPVARIAPVKTASQIAADEEKKILEQKKDNPVVKGITEAAKPNEIPKAPTRNGFDLDEALK